MWFEDVWRTEGWIRPLHTPLGRAAFVVYLSLSFQFSFLWRQPNSCTLELFCKTSQSARSADDQKIHFKNSELSSINSVDCFFNVHAAICSSDLSLHLQHCHWTKENVAILVTFTNLETFILQIFKFKDRLSRVKRAAQVFHPLETISNINKVDPVHIGHPGVQVSVCVSDICSESLSKMPYWVITQEIRSLLALFTGNQSKMKNKNLQIRSSNEKLKTQKIKNKNPWQEKE